MEIACKILVSGEEMLSTIAFIKLKQCFSNSKDIFCQHTVILNWVSVQADFTLNWLRAHSDFTLHCGFLMAQLPL